MSETFVVLGGWFGLWGIGWLLAKAYTKWWLPWHPNGPE
jgi:hypothetical protein